MLLCGDTIPSREKKKIVFQRHFLSRKDIGEVGMTEE